MKHIWNLLYFLFVLFLNIVGVFAFCKLINMSKGYVNINMSRGYVNVFFLSHACKEREKTCPKDMLTCFFLSCRGYVNMFSLMFCIDIHIEN